MFELLELQMSSAHATATCSRHNLGTATTQPLSTHTRSAQHSTARSTTPTLSNLGWHERHATHAMAAVVRAAACWLLGLLAAALISTAAAVPLSEWTQGTASFFGGPSVSVERLRARRC